MPIGTSKAQASKAQVALEFMYATLILLFLAVMFIFAAGDKLSDFKSEKDVFLLNDLALTVKNEIDVAHSMGSGYVRTFELPATLEGSSYSVGLESGFVAASLGGIEVVVAVQPVNGSVVKGYNVIRKVGGNVTLN